MNTIQCSVCKEDKEQELFYAAHRGKKKGRCKECTKREAREWKAANPERNKATNKKWNDNNYSKKRYRDLKEQYGITPEVYEAMFISQNGCCKICNKHQDSLSRRLAVDHCHLTGRVRGLLCRECNLILGYSGDQISILETAIQYLIS